MKNVISNNIGILDPEGNAPNPLTGKAYSEKYKQLSKIWTKFPAYREAKNIIQDIDNNQVVLIVSGTGSGKTVLVPKYVLHAFNYNAKIAVTLPKQMIAKSAAEFAADTLDVELGHEVGYKYKGSDKRAVSDMTKLLYATDGTIVSKLLKDASLSEFNAVIVDEIHERKIQIDFLLYLLKETLKLRPEFKLILMSATIDAKLFESYYYNYQFKSILIGSGTNYPIQSIFLKNSISKKDYLKYGYDTIKTIQNDSMTGDILFFVTSISETQKACDELKSNVSDFCVEVFSGIDAKRQDLAQSENKYKTIYPDKKRKIVIATNVAESSLTIEGIVYVIDSGYELSVSYDPDLRAKVLEKKFISQAQAIQRKGRAGRTRSGICYHLYTMDDFENRMKKFPEPSILTSNIYTECLRFMHLPAIRDTANLLNVLSSFIDPPREKYIKSAIIQLIRLGLIHMDQINGLGDLVAEMQLDPMEAISLILAYRLKCTRELAAIYSMINASQHSIEKLFNKPKSSSDLMKKYTQARKHFLNKYGDHLSILNIYIEYIDNKKNIDAWCYKYFLKKSVLEKGYNYNKKNIYMMRNIISKYDLNNIMNLSDDLITKLSNLKIEYRILISIMYGFRLNVSKLTHKINNNSFLQYNNLNNSKDYIVYDELISNDGKLEFNIISRLSKKIIKIIPNIF